MKLYVAVLGLGLTYASVVSAQQQPLGCDPRLCALQINALNAVLALREAEVKANADDAKAAIAQRDWWEDACRSTPECNGTKPAASNER